MATLKVKIQEDVILENQDYGSKRTLEISSINEIYKRLVTCPASQTTTVAVFAGTVNDSAGAIDVQDSKYMRINNLDSSNAIIADPVLLYSGNIDTFQIDESETESTVILTVVSHWADFEKKSGRQTNNNSQQRFFNTDVGMEFASQTVLDIKWGRA